MSLSQASNPSRKQWSYSLFGVWCNCRGLPSLTSSRGSCMIFDHPFMCTFHFQQPGCFFPSLALPLNSAVPPVTVYRLEPSSLSGQWKLALPLAGVIVPPSGESTTLHLTQRCEGTSSISLLISLSPYLLGLHSREKWRLLNLNTGEGV